jgi:hypothetical protein
MNGKKHEIRKLRVIDHDIRSWYKETTLITFGIQVFEPRTIRTPPTVNAVQQLSFIPDQPGEMTVITGEWIYQFEHKTCH